MTMKAAGDRNLRSRLRVARFEDVPAILRLVERAIERGCRRHSDAVERHAVYASYAQAAFVDVLAGFETYVAERGDELTAYGQLDPSSGGLRALFVDARVQGQGMGRQMLAHVIERAAARGNLRVRGAMSLNAVPFYERCGFRRCAGREQLWAEGTSIAVIPMDRPITLTGNLP
jgi:GNAT superfamily N-acetyltransferase